MSQARKLKACDWTESKVFDALRHVFPSPAHTRIPSVRNGTGYARSLGNRKNGAGGKYKHEFDHGGTMFGDDHSRLAEILRGYKKARIVVSYYDDARIRELYEGWTFVEHTRQKRLHAQNGRGARPKEAPEVLIINGPSYARAA